VTRVRNLDRPSARRTRGDYGDPYLCVAWITSGTIVRARAYMLRMGTVRYAASLGPKVRVHAVGWDDSVLVGATDEAKSFFLGV